MPDHFFKALSIRPARVEDAATIFSLQKLCYSEDFYEEESAFRSKITSAQNLCWVAEDSAGLLAYVLSVPAKRGQLPCLNTLDYQAPDDADVLYLHDLSIFPRARRRGLKRLLLDKVFAQASQYGFLQVCLIAVQGSVPMWQKEGFTVVDCVAEILQSYGADAQLMVKALKNIDEAKSNDK
ncbi:MAG: GNAT family N-acetyltransferase [Pelistega sp.]|nr:GNAT family N-acetyltransferase [Pelistega sp.]